MQRLSVLGAVTVAVLGCASLGSLTPSSTSDAVIDDVTGKPPFVAGSCITAVDGHAVDRARGHVVTYVPVAIVTPGKHTLTVKLSDGETPETTTVSASFEAGKRYRIKRNNDSVIVVEDDAGRSRSGVMY
jgi:hypothetical protein